MRTLLAYFSQTGYLLPAPPIGLSYVAHAARAAGHAVALLDLPHAGDADSALRRELRRHDPELVGFSVRHIDNLSRQRPEWHLAELSRRIATVRQASSAKIVLGGPAITVLGPSALEHLDADFAVIGEGDVAFPALLSALESGASADGIPGVCRRDGAQVRYTPFSRLERFGASRMEDWLDWRAYEHGGSTWAVQTKRGCPLHCIYCPFPGIEGSVPRRRPVEEVVDEIERVMRTRRPRTFEIADTTFNVPLEPALELCEAIIRRGLRVNLTVGSVSAATVCEELLALMKRAGFRSMVLTAEAADDTMLRNLRKGFTTEHVHRAARLVRGSGIATLWFFMLGGPGETRETAETTVSFIERTLDWKTCLSVIATGIRILPGTELARQARESGYLPPDADLVRPAFYLSPQVEEDWLLARIHRAIATNPCIVHAAEQRESPHAWLHNRLFHLAGVAPPYWRLLPRLLRMRHVRRFRGGNPLRARAQAAPQA